MFDQADRGDAMRQHQLVVQRVFQCLGHFGAQHHFKRVFGERPTLRQLQRLLATVTVMVEIGTAGAHHAIAAVRIAQRNGNGPADSGVLGEMLEALPTNIVSGIADPEHRIQQQIHRAGAGADDQIGATDGAGKAGAGFGAHPLYGEQQAYRERNGEYGEQSSESAVIQARQGQAQQVHGLHLRGASGAIEVCQ